MYICINVAHGMKKFLTSNLDFIGMATSLLCAVHCSILPILLGFGLLNGLVWTQSAWMEGLILSISLIIASLSLIKSYQSHKSAKPLLICLIGFVLFGTAHVAGHGFHMVLATLGGTLIAAAHLINWRLSR